MMVRRQLTRALHHLCQFAGRGEDEGMGDDALLARFVARRDEAAFAALVQRHGPMVLAVCRRVLRQEMDAEDAFQAVFLVLARKAAAVRNKGSVGGWLYQVAYHVALKAREATAKRRERERGAQPGEPSGPATDVARMELETALDAELSRLPDKYRLPLVLCYVEGKTNEQAARELGWPSGSMAKRLKKGRELLRARLARRGLAPATALLTALAETASAAVPPTLVSHSVEAARLFATGTTAGASASATALAEEVLKTMTMTKTKVLLALTLFVGVVAAGVVGAVHPAAVPPKAEQAAAAGPDEAPKEKPPPARPDEAQPGPRGADVPLAGWFGVFPDYSLEGYSRTFQRPTVARGDNPAVYRQAADYGWLGNDYRDCTLTLARDPELRKQYSAEAMKKEAAREVTVGQKSGWLRGPWKEGDDQVRELVIPLADDKAVILKGRGNFRENNLKQLAGRLDLPGVEKALDKPPRSDFRRNKEAFRGLRKGASSNDVFAWVGRPDAVAGDARQAYEYRLPGGGRVLVGFPPDFSGVSSVTYEARDGKTEELAK
jgi:RNA polymerase sigma factor (sigma-70 family)